VTGIDIAPNLIEQAREKAKREGLNVKFEEGDAENLPYADGSFDAVITMFGAMFTPRPEVTAAELKRVCRSGGFIAMANWTPAGFIGQMFKLVAKHVPPPNMPSPLLWGVQDNIRQRLSEGVATLDVRPQSVTFRFPFGPAEVVETFLVYYGPTNKAFGALDEAKQAEIRRELEEQWAKANRATDGTTAVDSEYLRVLAVRD
jgi:SAM-dependent methyltransferase